jgi:hypothetical protein
MPSLFVDFTETSTFDFSFIEDIVLQQSLNVFIRRFLNYQRELYRQGINDNLCELIYLSEVIKGELFDRFDFHMKELRRIMIIDTSDGEQYIDVFDISFQAIETLIIHGYDIWKEIYFLYKQKVNCTHRRCSGEKTTQIMNEFHQIEKRFIELRITKTHEKINHWFSKDF